MVTQARHVARFAAVSSALALTLAGASARADEPPAPATFVAPASDTAQPSLPASNPALPAPTPAAEASTAQVFSGARSAPRPRVHHAPIATTPEKVPLTIAVDLEHPELVRAAVVVYRDKKGVFGVARLMRGEGLRYLAQIPKEVVVAPSIAYAIELERVDGSTEAAFATRAEPHVVAVLEDEGEARERALDARLLGRRSVVTTSAEYVRFGETQPSGDLVCAAGQDRCAEGTLITPSQAAVDDQYYRVEAGYTYRPLGVVSEFSLRGGVIRGTSLVPGGTFDEKAYEVGANYGAPTVRFRMADAWHLDVEFLTSITEIGFSVGFGSALLIGDPYGTKLTAGFETIGPGNDDTYFGSRFFTRLDIVTGHDITVAPIIEVTDMPHADAFGVRLLGEGTVDLGSGFAATLRGGYQARRSTSGGPTLGGALSLAF